MGGMGGMRGSWRRMACSGSRMVGVLASMWSATSCSPGSRAGPVVQGGGPSASASAFTSSIGEREPASRRVATGTILRRTADYPSWARFDEHRDGAVKSRGHHALWVVAYYNDVAAPAVSGRLDAFPPGSIIVGENRAEPDGPPVALSMMAKRAQGWHWIEHGPDGTVMMTGELEPCMGCHSRAQRDMVFGGVSDANSDL